jgi:hypothetical protein
MFHDGGALHHFETDLRQTSAARINFDGGPRKTFERHINFDGCAAVSATAAVNVEARGASLARGWALFVSR